MTKIQYTASAYLKDNLNRIFQSTNKDKYNCVSCLDEAVIKATFRVAESDYVPHSVGFETIVPPKVLAYN